MPLILMHCLEVLLFLMRKPRLCSISWALIGFTHLLIIIFLPKVRQDSRQIIPNTKLLENLCHRVNMLFQQLCIIMVLIHVYFAARKSNHFLLVIFLIIIYPLNGNVRKLTALSRLQSEPIRSFRGLNG